MKQLLWAQISSSSISFAWLAPAVAAGTAAELSAGSEEGLTKQACYTDTELAASAGRWVGRRHWDSIESEQCRGKSTTRGRGDTKEQQDS